MARMTVVDRDGKEHEIEAKTGLKLMEILRELDYGVAAICGGLCSCATCHVYVDEKWIPLLPKRQSDELELLNELPDFGRPPRGYPARSISLKSYRGSRSPSLRIPSRGLYSD